MTLSFPNPTRWFDEARSAIGFVAHDGLRTITFFVDAAVFSGASAGSARDGSQVPIDYMSAFDRLRATIHDVAREAYSNGRVDCYRLTPGDFR